MHTGNKLSWFRRHPFASAALISTAIAFGPLSMDAQADGGSGKGGGGAALAAPDRAGTGIINNAAAIRLGKALFWDSQSGGDGQIACATCHFHAGADNRTFNTLHPGPDGIFASGGVTAAGQNFSPSNIVNDDRVGSQVIVGSIFVSIDANPHQAADHCTPNETAPFFHNRRVTGRNTPSVVNATFNRQNFWDGRANDNFNGSDPFGLTGNAGPGIGQTATNSSLASQAVGPPNNPTEMACEGRTFNGPNSLVNEDGGDQGFHNTGVTPTAEDVGRAGTGPNGVAWSQSGSPMDRGAFKTPALRNDKLTAPYMHNGGKATLADVVDFYDRGGDVQNPELAKRIKKLGLSSSDKAALVDFLMNALTDCRTEREEAPFDHPSLVVPNGVSVPATGGGHTCQ